MSGRLVREKLRLRDSADPHAAYGLYSAEASVGISKQKVLGHHLILLQHEAQIWSELFLASRSWESMLALQRPAHFTFAASMTASKAHACNITAIYREATMKAGGDGWVRK